MKRIRELGQLPMFRDFSRADLEALEVLMPTTRVEDRHIFFAEGEHADGTNAKMHLILDGVVRVRRRPPGPGGFGISLKLGTGEIFGEVAMVLDRTRTASCTADGPVSTAVLTRVAFEQMLSGQAALAAKFQHLLARSLVADVRRTNRMLTQGLSGQ